MRALACMRAKTAVLTAVLGAALAAPDAAWAFDVVAAMTVPGPVELRAGETRNVVIEVIVKPGHHVQANPAAQPTLIPTVLTLASAPGVTVGTPRYPAPKRLRLAGSGDELLVYDRRFVIVVPITLTKRAAVSVRLEGSLRYQGCDGRHCFFPRTTPITLVVGSGAARVIDGARRGKLEQQADWTAKAGTVLVF
jgi:DsbC/DsbD-like thiol-disulfide interchange protein